MDQVVKMEVFVTPPLETNTYVARCGRNCAIVDPGMTPVAVVRYCRKEKLTPHAVLLTHGHGDHIAGIGDLKEAFPGLRVICPEGDAEMLSDANLNLSAPFGISLVAPDPDDLVRPGQTVRIGESSWLVLDTSGHSPGGVSYYCADSNVVLTGDALFNGSIGRVDIPGANEFRLLENIRRNLLSLPDQTRVLPGHGPETTIGRERQANPFLRTF